VHTTFGLQLADPGSASQHQEYHEIAVNILLSIPQVKQESQL